MTSLRSISRWILAVSASPLGVFVLAALDSTIFFNLPFGIDATVVILSARLHELAWIVPLLATTGSMVGAAITFWMGVMIGENGLDRFVPPQRLKRIRHRVKNSGAFALALLDLVPPPFPFTPFLLAAGALEVQATTFFATLTGCRVLRFGTETVLALVYGQRILAWLESDILNDIVIGCTALAVVLTSASLVMLMRSTRPSARGRRRSAA